VCLDALINNVLAHTPDGVSAAGGPDSSALTTSWWATTDAGRSVTSAATMDVAAQTSAVDARVAVSQSPPANNRADRTAPGCSPATTPVLNET